MIKWKRISIGLRKSEEPEGYRIRRYKELDLDSIQGWRYRWFADYKDKVLVTNTTLSHAKRTCILHFRIFLR